MHTRSIECEGFLRDDGLWEVEAWLRDTKPFVQRADRFRGELTPSDPVHDIGLRLAIDDGMTIREAEAMMRALSMLPLPMLYAAFGVAAWFLRIVGWRRRLVRIAVSTALPSASNVTPMSFQLLVVRP